MYELIFLECEIKDCLILNEDEIFLECKWCIFLCNSNINIKI